LKHEDPALRIWWQDLYSDKDENFVPDAAHVYAYEELKALAKDSKGEKRANRGD
jgi:hypothetical protein